MKAGCDCFAVLGLERRAALEEGAIAEAFHALSREAHPDAGAAANGGPEFEVAGEAYRRLKDPGSRLVHLLELEFPERGGGGEEREMISGDLLEFFGRIGEAMQGADAVLKQKAESRTALGKAMLAPEEMARQEALRELGTAMNELIEEVEGRLAEVDALLVADRARAAALGAELARRLRYLSKWRAQIREKIAAFF